MKIAIVRRNGLGDLLCSFPLIQYLYQNYPQAKITLFVDERNAPLLPFLPKVDEVVVFPAKGNKYLNILKTAFSYRGQFELAISAKTSPMKLVNVFLAALGAKKRLAYVNPRCWSRFLINYPITFDEDEAKTKHQALKALRMIAPQFQEVPENLFPKMHVDASLKTHYARPKNGIVLLLSASTTRPSSRLDERRYGALVNKLYSECGPFEVRLLSQEEDEPRAHALMAELKVPGALYFPRNFEDFIVLMDESDLYFVGDGGIGHIGAALGKHEVVLFGQTNPAEWAPLGGSRVETFYDRIHVNRLSDDEIYDALKRKMHEVISGRENNQGEMGNDPSQPFSTKTSVFRGRNR